MQILVDACVARNAVDALGGAGHDTDWVGAWDEDPGDAEILRRAAEAGRILVTLDRDFGEIAVVRRQPHCGIIRLVGLASTEQGAACIAVLQRHGDVLAAGGIVTVERGRVRVRPSDDERSG